MDDLICAILCSVYCQKRKCAKDAMKIYRFIEENFERILKSIGT